MAITHEWHERMAHARAWHTHTHACGTHKYLHLEKIDLTGEEEK